MQLTKIKENLRVYAKGESGKPGTPGVPIGTVEHMDGEKYIKLTESDSPDGHPHWLPVDWVEAVDDQAVYLNKTQDQIVQGLMVYHCRSASH
jgi:hypothetical protein